MVLRLELDYWRDSGQNPYLMDAKAGFPDKIRNAGLRATFLLLLAVLLLLFFRALLPGHTLFSNDGPLGTLASAGHQVPQAFTGSWEDLNTIGIRGGGVWVGISGGLRLVLGPVLFSKTYVPISLLILGLGAWAFFRQLGLASIACILGAVAGMLNSGFFSAAAWGVASHAIAVGMLFFALAALARNDSPYHWLRVLLGGFALGMAVIEGADVGALFSMFVATFVLYQAWLSPGTPVRRLTKAVVRIAVVAMAAAVLAAQTVSGLIETQVKGIAGTGQDSRTREQRWDWATQWSYPKSETFALIVPGLFGYRMDTPEGGNYWGAAGRDPAWDRYFASGKQGQAPGGFLRFSGGGVYAGVLVVLVAAWTLAQSFRKEKSVFSLHERKFIWFWAVIALLALLLSWGRFAPFYQFLYVLPYFSTIRNPAKFLHFVSVALVVLFALGISRIWSLYMDIPAAAAGRLGDRVKAWYARARGFDKRWVIACGMILAGSLLGWLIYASSQDALVRHLQEVGFGDEKMANAIASFSVRQVFWFVLFFTLSAGLLVLIFSGAFAGARAGIGGWALLVLLVVDLGRANLPWVIVWNYEQKYATNPVIETLREKPYEQRVAILPSWINNALRAPPELELIDQLYRIEWAQHHFLYYDIQSLDIVQMPRMPEDLIAFETALQPRSMADVSHLVARRWELTNTRYLLGAADFVPFLNQQLDAGKERFRIAQRFQIVPKAGITNPTKLEELTAVASTNGNFALIEFTGALPRAKLYSNWQVVTNDQVALETLAGKTFDPHSTVLVSSPLPSASAGATNEAPGTFSFVSYAPKHIVLQAEAKGPAVLLLNDRYDPNWKVFVDGKPSELLRSNYIMRGVFLTPGPHRVEFRFDPPIRPLYVSLGALALAILVAGYLLVAPKPARKDESESVAPADKPEKRKEK